MRISREREIRRPPGRDLARPAWVRERLRALRAADVALRLLAAILLVIALGTALVPPARAQNTLTLNVRPDYVPLSFGRQLSFDFTPDIFNLTVQEIDARLSGSTVVVNLPAGVNFLSATVPASVSGSAATGEQVTLNMGTVRLGNFFHDLLSVSVSGTVADGTTLQATFDLSGTLFITSQIASATRDATGTTVTVRTNGVNGFVAGETVTIAGATDPTFNGTFLIASVGAFNTFTYAQAGTPNATAGFAGTATVTLGPIDSGAVNVSFQGGYLPVTVFVDNYSAGCSADTFSGPSPTSASSDGSPTSVSSTSVLAGAFGLAATAVGVTDRMFPALSAPSTPTLLGEIAGPGAELSVILQGTNGNASGGFTVAPDLSAGNSLQATISCNVNLPQLSFSNPNSYTVPLQLDIRSEAFAAAGDESAGFPSLSSSSGVGLGGLPPSACCGIEASSKADRLLYSPSGNIVHTVAATSCFPDAPVFECGPPVDITAAVVFPGCAGGICDLLPPSGGLLIPPGGPTIVSAFEAGATDRFLPFGVSVSASGNSRITFDPSTGLVTLIRSGYGSASAAMSIRVTRGDANIGVLEATTPSKLQITGHSPITLLVTDSQGRRIGLNPAATPPPLPGTPPPTVREQPTILTEIPGASYSGINSDPQTISIPDPVPGDYTVLATGTASGSFTVTMQTLNVNGVSVGSQESTGTASPGSSNTIALTIQNDGSVTLKTPSCAADASSSMSVVRSGFSYNFFTGRFVQAVTLTNTTASAIAGPISLVLDNLSSNATLFNASGQTACAAPLGSPFVVPVASGSDLAAGASVTVYLQFTDPTKAGITYTTRALAGSGSP